MTLAPIVSPEEWQAARHGLLVKEKELTRPATRWPPSAADAADGR